MSPKYPSIEVQLTNDNPLIALGQAKRGLQTLGVDKAEIEEFEKEAKSDNIDYLRFTIMDWVTVV